MRVRRLTATATQPAGFRAQVLGNEESRARYDKNGKAGIEPNQMVDPAMLFTLMFGGEQFEPFFGELAVASVAAAAMDPAQSKNIRTVDLDRCVAHAPNLKKTHASHPD